MVCLMTFVYPFRKRVIQIQSTRADITRSARSSCSIAAGRTLEAARMPSTAGSSQQQQPESLSLAGREGATCSLLATRILCLQHYRQDPPAP